ncbi:MAG: UbiA prenyltransferase family protein [Candidatus Bathyarchaeota archaeon]
MQYSLASRSFQFLGAIYRAIRFSSILCFTSTTFVGAILASSTIDFRMVWLLTFSAFSTALGFLLNDLSDAELDKSAGVMRNPVSTGELSRGKGTMIASFFLLVSMTPLSYLSLQNQLLGLVVIFLYFTYSFIVRAKARPVLDVAYHGLCPMILATMGWTECRPFDVTCFLLASLVFLLHGVSQILQEVRDYETDRHMIRTTVTLLGTRRSLILCLAFFASAFAVCLPLLFYGVIPLQILLLSPLAYFIIAPIFRAIRNEEDEKRMLKEIQEKRLILIAASIAALILGG